MDEPEHTKRASVPWIFFCVAVAIAYVLTVPRTWQCEGVDEIEYLGLAHSLERGDGFSLYGEPYTIYPPLYPALLSLVMRHDVTAWRPMYALNALLGFAGVVYLATWLRKSRGRNGRWAGWFALFSYYAWSFSTRYLMADALFVLVSSIALVQTDKMLRDDRTSPFPAVLSPFGLLLSAMTKASAVALSASLCWSVALFAVLKRRSSLLLFCVALAAAGFGFSAAWELHGAKTNPEARESYFRWGMKLIGLSDEQQGMIAQNEGEGLEHRASLPVRVVLLGFKFGQYAMSAVRVPGNFGPLALFIWLVFLTGIVAHARREPWSPLAWYALFSLAMFSLTHWVSSYTRYLYPLTPLLYFFLVEGAVAWKRSLVDRQRRPAWIAVAVFGLAGLLWTIVYGFGGGAGGLELRYVTALGVGCATAYAAMSVGGLCACAGWSTPRRALPFECVVSMCVVVFALHSGVLAASRFKRTLADETLKSRNLGGAVACGRWIKDHAAPDAIVVSSLPRLLSFLSDRTATGFGGRPDGYVVTMGTLRDVPAFRAEDEERVKAFVAQNGLTRAFSFGDAAVYKTTNQ